VEAEEMTESIKLDPLLSVSQLEAELGVKLPWPGEPNKIVGVTIRVDEQRRVWWNMQAKLQRTTATEAIIKALDARFGLPEID
jgi:hypothetical protein